MKQPNYIALEGLEGAGKTTALKTITEFLNQKGFQSQNVREPGGTPMAEALRNLFKHGDFGNENVDVRTEALIMYASRCQLISNVVTPLLNDGKVVLTDRSHWTTKAYQGENKKVMELIADLDKHICDAMPNLVIFMDVDPELGLERARGRDALDRIEQRDIQFFINARKRFLQFAKENNDMFIVIDANQDIDKVQKEIIDKLNNIY